MRPDATGHAGRLQWHPQVAGGQFPVWSCLVRLCLPTDYRIYADMDVNVG